MRTIRAALLYSILFVILASPFRLQAAVPEEYAAGEKEVYIPSSFSDPGNPSSRWSYDRSMETENWIVFWEAGYGTDPSSDADPNLRVNVPDVLSIAEKSFILYRDSLKFILKGSSKTDQYKMIILLFYTSDWIASGSGVDEVIGQLNLSAWGARAGSITIAHEVGHCFQYQAGADQHPLEQGEPLVGWRWGFGPNGSGGNGWWEQCAQWQAFKVYPGNQFDGVGDHYANAHLHFLHEYPRYMNYFIQDYWTSLHGWDFTGRLWRETRFPEDPVETYKRITGINQKQFNDEMYIRAARFVTWDIPHLEVYGREYILARDPDPLLPAGGDAWIIDPAKTIQNYGYNVVRLNLPDTGNTVRIIFEGKSGAEGYRSINPEDGGWRYGFVALLKNGKRVYSPMASSEYNKLTRSNPLDTLYFNVPDQSEFLWFVVSGAPQRHWHHAWDDNDSNDEQWPYRLKFENTGQYGNFTFDPDAQPASDTLTELVTLLPVTANEYPYTPVSPDWEKVCRAFKLNLAEIEELMGTSIRYCAVNPDGSFNYQSTAIAPGHWFADNGNVAVYSSTNSHIFSEFRIASYAFNIGQYPNRCQAGDAFTIRQALVYTPPGEDPVHVIFTFRIKIVSPDNPDGDSYPDGTDNCPAIYNEDQSDLDGDGIGDACDLCPGSDDQSDTDGDGVPDGCDQCPGSDDYLDSDGDTVPDGCDICAGSNDNIDTDGDGLPDGCDICPVSDDHTDTDGDGVPDACDLCEGSDDAVDSDGDTVPDDCDACPGSSDLLDTDKDGFPDDCDICPVSADHTDTDGDGIPDACDLCEGFDDAPDADGDNVPDACDICAGSDDHSDADEDGVPDGCDICAGSDDSMDSDADGVPDGCDKCEGYDDSVETDRDGIPDSCDICQGYSDFFDSDKDGVPNGCDLCPGSDDSIDSDEDGVPDGCDLCEGFDDNIDTNDNGIPDGCDGTGIEPLIPKILVNPNPSGNFLRVNWSSANISHPDIKIFDLSGRLQIEISSVPGVETNIELGIIQPGMYLLVMSTEKETYTCKFVKE